MLVFQEISEKGGAQVAKNYEIAVLIDFYGEMLTAKQRDFLEYYYNDDLSLSEIAENEGITRQGVRDAIKRAETQLQEMESKLGVARRFEDMKRSLDEIIECSNQISEYNLRHSLSKEINDCSVRIKAAAMLLLES
ncbi:MAG: YlxM family DNA-binding protein [Clostridia bacterium]|nr:YlxM family DNA-binding protein [Clostridia bacterium]